MKITTQMLKEARTKKGSYTRKQIEIAQKIFPGKWKAQMLGSDILESEWESFVKAGSVKSVSLKRWKLEQKKVINSMSVDRDWSWNPQPEDIPTVKRKGTKNRGKKKAKNKKVVYSEDFYTSKEWRMLRVRVLEKYECKCMMCGESPKEHGIVIHVDHIQPRSLFPELALEFTNLQLLCCSCNLGKSNKYKTDWRPNEEWELVFEANKHI